MFKQFFFLLFSNFCFCFFVKFKFWIFAFYVTSQWVECLSVRILFLHFHNELQFCVFHKFFTSCVLCKCIIRWIHCKYLSDVNSQLNFSQRNSLCVQGTVNINMGGCTVHIWCATVHMVFIYSAGDLPRNRQLVILNGLRWGRGAQ